ncbi:MAG: hypothetical protein HKN91_10815, partial [Acidimicrobiia bacterium]|nr:hypothetical protein [Acidimicrobiia bacterium]
CEVCPRAGELSQDGQRLAYSEIVDDVRYIVLRHSASGAEVRRIRVDGDWRIDSLDLSAKNLVVNRSSDDGLLAPWIYDLSQVDPEPVPLSVVGEGYLTLAPVTVQGPVPAP